MIDLHSVIVIASGLCGGVFLGALIPTQTERNIRGFQRGRLFLIANSNILLFLLVQIVLIIVVGGIFTLISVTTLKIGGAYPLCATDKYTYAFSILFGAGFAKWIRYLYWKRQDQYIES